MERTPVIITLTSDFGLRDYHLALIKGHILRQCPHARLIDISHDIANYNIVEAAFLFKHAWQAFPQGTIHLLSVNDFDQIGHPFLVFAHQGHYFVGPDNGLFSLVFPDQPTPLFAVELGEDETTPNFPIAGILAKAAGHLAQDFPAGALGSAVEGWVERITFQPVTSPNQIRATVVYIDKFENIVTNIDRTLFEQVGKNRAFELFFKRHSPITSLSADYHDVAVGEILCRFNSAGLLEIAMNMQGAASLLGLKVEDTVQVDFRG